jgi:hypothetical protein
LTGSVLHLPGEQASRKRVIEQMPDIRLNASFNWIDLTEASVLAN